MDVVESGIRANIGQCNKSKMFGPKKCPVYLRRLFGLVRSDIDLLSKSLKVRILSIFPANP